MATCEKAMPNRNYVKRPRARKFQSPQSNKKNTNLLVKCSNIILMLRYSEKKYNYTLTKTININVHIGKHYALRRDHNPGQFMFIKIGKVLERYRDLTYLIYTQMNETQCINYICNATTK